VLKLALLCTFKKLRASVFEKNFPNITGLSEKGINIKIHTHGTFIRAFRG